MKWKVRTNLPTTAIQLLLNPLTNNTVKDLIK